MSPQQATHSRSWAQSVTLSESKAIEFDVAFGVTLKPSICQWYPTL